MLQAIINTAGDGFWSDVAKEVEVTGFDVQINKAGTFGELRVFFKPETWDINEDGLIYTDSKFEAELAKIFKAMFIDPSDMSYSEQGMQGSNYVDMDVDTEFVDAWLKLDRENG